MRGWKGWVLITSLVFNAAFLAGFLMRHAPLPFHGPRSEERMDAANLHKRLGLSPEQERVMRASRLKMQGDMDAYTVRLTGHKEALTALLAADPVDKDAIQTELARMADIQASIQQAVVGHYIEMRKQLTPDQRKKFDEILRGRMCPHLCNGFDPRPMHGRAPCGEAGDDDATKGGDGPSEKKPI